jgi:hypothetical protein
MCTLQSRGCAARQRWPEEAGVHTTTPRIPTMTTVPRRRGDQTLNSAVAGSDRAGVSGEPPLTVRLDRAGTAPVVAGSVGGTS